MQVNQSSISRLVNLSTLGLSGNPIVNLEDIKGIAMLPSIWNLMFACEHFEPCPIVELPNYRDYILITLKNGAAFESI